MTSLEGPIAGWALTKLGPVGKWLSRRILRDHQPILGRKGSPARDYDAFYLFVAVAPSNSPQSHSSLDFIDSAHRFVTDGLSDMFTGKAEYSGSELVRWRQPINSEPVAPKNSVLFYPSGLIELQWVLEIPPDTSLKLDEILAIVDRMRVLVEGDAHTRLYRSRRLERWRRVDWRIGINGRALPRKAESVDWTDLVASVPLPRDRVDEPHPYCPPDGYGASAMTSRLRSSRLEELLSPVLEGLLSTAGYTNAGEIRNCVAELLRHYQDSCQS